MRCRRPAVDLEEQEPVKAGGDWVAVRIAGERLVPGMLADGETRWLGSELDRREAHVGGGERALIEHRARRRRSRQRAGASKKQTPGQHVGSPAVVEHWAISGTGSLTRPQARKTARSGKVERRGRYRQIDPERRSCAEIGGE
jgi:hypothetical protein